MSNDFQPSQNAQQVQSLLREEKSLQQEKSPQLEKNFQQGQSFEQFQKECQIRCNQLLLELMQNSAAHDTKLIEAMEYSLLNGGKRVRPLLAYAAAQATGAINEATDEFACALECIHTYSLIHDDLPAMDDDSLRRGKPTCHIQYDEATAILAGDALQCLAFEMLANSRSLEPQPLLKAIQELAWASGAHGMVLGQAIDLASVNTTLDLQQLERMHGYKTGALIEASVIMGAISAGATSLQIKQLRQYSKAIGLAFQVQDDIIDATSDSETLGKPQGSDQQKNKPTYLSLLGLERAKQKANELKELAHQSLEGFDHNADQLRALASYIVQRKA